MKMLKSISAFGFSNAKMYFGQNSELQKKLSLIHIFLKTPLNIPAKQSVSQSQESMATKRNENAITDGIQDRNDNVPCDNCE